MNFTKTICKDLFLGHLLFIDQKGRGLQACLSDHTLSQFCGSKEGTVLCTGWQMNLFLFLFLYLLVYFRGPWSAQSVSRCLARPPCPAARTVTSSVSPVSRRETSTPAPPARYRFILTFSDYVLKCWMFSFEG